MEDVHFDSILKLLVCKVHGSGIHPTKEGIKRHLRSEGHRCKGETLRQAISTLTNLPLGSLAAMRDSQPAVDAQPVAPPIPHLRVLHGWNCIYCEGDFLTTSRELVQRHASAKHERRRGEPSIWEACKLQTFFSETKHRRYFRVMSLPDAYGPSTEEEDHTRNQIDSFAHVQTCREKVTGDDNLSTHTRARPDSVMRNILVRRRTTSTPANASDVWLSRVSHLQQSWPLPSLANSLTIQHPYTSFAAKHVSLPVAYIDTLFKSDAFRAASKPLFDTIHVDSVLSMRAVFPQSEKEPVFLNALLYSMIQISNHGRSTIKASCSNGK